MAVRHQPRVLASDRAPPGASVDGGPQRLTPKTWAIPTSPETYPWPMARNFHSAPFRYSSPKTIAVSVDAFGVLGWYDRKGLHRIPAETKRGKTAVPA